MRNTQIKSVTDEMDRWRKVESRLQRVGIQVADNLGPLRESIGEFSRNTYADTVFREHMYGGKVEDLVKQELAGIYRQYVDAETKQTLARQGVTNAEEYAQYRLEQAAADRMQNGGKVSKATQKVDEIFAAQKEKLASRLKLVSESNPTAVMQRFEKGGFMGDMHSKTEAMTKAVREQIAQQRKANLKHLTAVR